MIRSVDSEEIANRRTYTVALSELCSGKKDPNGFSDLITHAHKLLDRTFHDKHLVDDAIGDTMIDVMRHSEHFQNAENRLAYFLRAARNRAIRLIRRDQTRRAVVRPSYFGLDTVDPSEEGLAEERVMVQENHEAYCKFLQELENGQSPHHAKIVEWRLEFGDSHAEIARKLRGKMTERVVRGTWCKLSKRLMEVLDME